MTILGGLIDHSIARKVLDGLVAPLKGNDATVDPISDTHDTLTDPSNRPDTLTPPKPEDRHDNGWHHGQNTGSGDRETGGTSPRQGLEGGMQTGGPAPQGLQDVVPNIVRQLASTLSYALSGAESQARSTASDPPTTHVPRSVPAPVAQATANAPAQASQAALQGQAGTAAQQAAAAPATSLGGGASATQATQATMPNTVANLASPAFARSSPGGIGDAAALAQTRAADMALPPRTENVSLLSRLATALQLAPMAPTTTPPVVTLPLPAVTQPVTAAGLTMATAAVNQPVDARGVILAANDHAAIRSDNAVTLAGHTLDGLQRRSLRNRGQLLPDRMSRLLWALGLMGTQASEPDPHRELQRAMQWLFWMLAVIAYGCLAVAIVALVGSNGRVFDYEVGRTYTGWLACFGLVTAAVAWIVARRMARRRS